MPNEAVPGPFDLKHDLLDEKLIHVFPSEENQETMESVSGYGLWLRRHYPFHRLQIHWPTHELGPAGGRHAL